MDATDFFGSKAFKMALAALGIFLIAIFSFAGGVAVGLKKARFSYKFGENYERNFLDGRPPRGPMDMMRPNPREMMRDFEGRGFRNAHGISGEIISVSDGKIVIKDKNDEENTVSVTDQTIIKLGRNEIGINDLKNGERLVVMGRPGDDGTVTADLIRVFDDINANNESE